MAKIFNYLLVLVILLAVLFQFDEVEAKPSKKPKKTKKGKKIFKGHATYYFIPDGGRGACGPLLTNTSMVAALSKDMFDATMKGLTNPNKNPICGHRVRVKGPLGSITVTIQDRCPGCKKNSLDWQGGQGRRPDLVVFLVDVRVSR
ncbi:hypothetical protein BC938DRAFT_479437 [Jimgerdemannia flammicorona]|uniref:RlpA-like double-psi beta-barrel-protein domain-containing protein-containing protein n=1 Tax=Jimgerdemannia flammicorona TaxID=994334 RepID=A0A433QKW5_9FUNG|nr:hypothetical protein BC938DRAFT_479437 [Jimgerdemannia flammicorona]